jgi:hypothetical protein
VVLYDLRMFKRTDEERIARFWAKVDRRGPNECWPWLAKSRANGGYGQFGYRSKCFKAHRFAKAVSMGLDPLLLPSEWKILHSCDNPPCCNPAHLRVGSMKDNAADMVKRDRRPRKLTREQVEAIRDERGVDLEIAKRYGVSRAYVSHIKRGIRPRA